MPYSTLADLPEAQVDQYSTHQKHAFLKAFNNALEEYGGDESRAFAVAHTAAQQHPEDRSRRGALQLIRCLSGSTALLRSRPWALGTGPRAQPGGAGRPRTSAQR